MKLQLKRSNAYTGTTSPRAQIPTPPTAPQTLDGELCVNYNDGDPALFIKTDAGNIARVDGNYQAYDLNVDTVSGGGAKIDLIHQTSGLNASTTKHTVNFIGGTGVSITESSADNIEISISGASDIGVDLGVTTSSTQNVITNTAGDNATLVGASSTAAGLLVSTLYDRLQGLNSDPVNITGTAPISATRGTSEPNLNSWTIAIAAATESSLGAMQVGTGLDVADGVVSVDLSEITAGIDLDYTQAENQGTVTNSGGDNATLTLANDTYAGLLAPADKIKLDDLPTLGSGETYDNYYLQEVTAGNGINVSVPGGSSTPPNPTPTIEVDLASNQGLEFNASTPGDLQIISGTGFNDALLWQIDGGAQAIVVASISGPSSQAQGSYQNISTTGGGGTGCTVDFYVAADNTVSNLTIQNPGANYDESAVITVTGHGFTFTLANDAGNGRYAFTGWRTSGIDLGYTAAPDQGTVTNSAGTDATLPLADSTNAGLLAPGDKDKLDNLPTLGTGQDYDNRYIQTITGGDGIDVSTTGTNPNPTVAVDLINDQGLEFNGGELQIISGTAFNDVLLWQIDGGARTVLAGSISRPSSEAEGRYENISTTASEGSGCTVNFDVAADNTVSNLTIQDPGSGYIESEVITVVGHSFTFTLETDANNGRYTFTGWRTGEINYDDRYISTVTAGDGIAISTSGSDPTPTVAVDLVSNQGLEFDTSSPGDLRIIQGTAVNDGLLWQVAGGARTILISSISGPSSEDEGNYQNISTTATAGSGCTVDFDVDDSNTVSNLTIQNPGSGYAESAQITVAGHGFTFNLQDDANNGRYTFTGWRTGALPSSGGGGGSIPNVPDGLGVFQLNTQVVESDYTLPEGYNAVSAGPITINDGVTVTINDGENWSIV